MEFIRSLFHGWKSKGDPQRLLKSSMLTPRIDVKLADAWSKLLGLEHSGDLLKLTL